MFGALSLEWFPEAGLFARQQVLTDSTRSRTANIFSPAFAYPENNLHRLHFFSCESFPMGYRGGVAASNTEPQTEPHPMNANATATHPTVTVNLTGKLSTSAQIDAWVGDLSQEERDTVTLLLTDFQETPTRHDIRIRASRLAAIAEGWVQRMSLPPETPVLIEGPPFLIPALARYLQAVGLKPVFAVTERNLLDGTDTLRFVEYVG